MKRVSSADQAIDELGGTRAVAGMFKNVSGTTVSMWRSRGFPSRAFRVLAPVLKQRGLICNPYRLFGMLEPSDYPDV